MPLELNTAASMTDQTESQVTDGLAEQTPAEPASMLDAINGELDSDEQSTEQSAESDDAAKAEADAAAAAAADPKAKKDDLTRLPDGLAPEAQKRFQHLVGTLKTERQAREAAEAKAHEHEGTISGLRQLMEETQTSADDFGALLEYNRMCKTGNWDHARALLEDQLKWISIHQGKPAPGIDALADFPDLRHAVTQQQVSEEYALEIARSRTTEGMLRQAQQRANQSRQGEQQRSAQVNDAVRSVDAWAAKMAASDVDWPAKEKLLEAKMEWLAANAPPAQWLGHLQQWYGLIAVPKAAQTEKPRPLASGNGPSGAVAAPSDMRQAIDQALGFA